MLDPMTSALPKTLRECRRQPITVGALMEALAAFDADMPVIVDGYEGGYDSLTTDNVLAITIAPDVVKSDQWWYGDHERSDVSSSPSSEDTAPYSADPSSVAPLAALLLSRGDKARGS